MRDINYLSMGDDARLQGLLSKRIDAAVTSPPNTQKLAAEGMRVLAGPEISDMPSNGLATTVSLLEKEPELVKSMLNPLVDGVVWARSNPDAANTFFAAKYKLPVAIAAAAYRQQMQVLRWHVTDQQLQKAFKLALQAVGSPQRTEITDAIELSLYREIIRSRRLSD